MMVRSLQQLNTPWNEKAHLDQVKFSRLRAHPLSLLLLLQMVVLGKAETRLSVHFLSQLCSCGP